MYSQIHTFEYPNGELQRVQLVRWDSWSRVRFLRPDWSPAVFESFCRVYRSYLVPGCPWVFGQLVLFSLPQGAEPEGYAGEYGGVEEAVLRAAMILRRGVKIRGGKPVFRTTQARKLWTLLEENHCVELVRGKLPFTQIIPIGRAGGYLQDSLPQAEMKVNASFFIMDPFDCATAYDQVGTPLGLCLRNGVVENPPLFQREALLVRNDGSVSIEKPRLEDLEIHIGDKKYIPGVNAELYTRPQWKKTPAAGKQLVIVGCRVAAVCAGRVDVPASGFVLCPREEATAQAGDAVAYRGMEDYLFGIQVGNSIIRGGEETLEFISNFYNIYALERTPYPPSLYPLDFKAGRAARIALGADIEGKPMLLWAEGAGKLRYAPGQDSRGATLEDMADICSRLGMHNAVNLDGGGSAQILLQGKRSLRLSDRDPLDNSDSPRPVPMALAVETETN